MSRSTLYRATAILVLLGLGLAALGYAVAVSTPVVRRAELTLPGLRGRPLKLLLISDIHVAGPDMPPERLADIVDQINRIGPDLVLIGGDFIGDKGVGTRIYSDDEIAAPLAGLKARLGVFAVLGNHDHWRDPAGLGEALRHAGVRLLDNQAARAGPFAIGGVDDAYTDHDDLPLTLRRMRAAGGVPVLLSHSPDPFPDVPGHIRLVLAGHTHCGQISLPLIGPLSTMSRYGDRYACGLMIENGKTLVVGAGVGTSILPLRLGARPDMWLISVRGR
ncbi:metallophosphoesterase [Sphingosinicella sp. BN140058]|uniref:metallophosphoesterase n=1 Tax=Sphingosinicella sp. BN140058 TaxID=1892855 RepID=UPI0010117EF6|nr:metallophosphoesterase [Sphingosinicella sp. BN140058]QAY76078.1 phosphohydrolase [Sphingosinicella sp. BN140058]